MPDKAEESPGVTRSSVATAPFGSGLLVAIFTILVVMALRLGSALLIPITVSLLLSLLLGPLVRWLRQRGVPEWIGAGVLVFGTIGLLGTVAGLLAGPAADWIQRAPATLSQVEAKLQRLQPFKAIQQTAQQVEQAATPSDGTAPRKVEVQRPGLLTRVSGGTATAALATLTVVFLTYFLLATGQRFRRRMVGLPLDPLHQERIEHALNEIERQTSRYLVFTTTISIGVGGATWALLATCGLPNAGLWAVIAGVLNFVPYVGALATTMLIGAAALLSFDGVELTLVAVGGFLLIHLVAGNIITPAVLGRKLPLNTVALFVCLLFWGWVWGVLGAILAVPLTVMLRVICDHVDRLRPVAVLLDD
jgi:predicted PurR-regulated permease PerM